MEQQRTVSEVEKDIELESVDSKQPKTKKRKTSQADLRQATLNFVRLGEQNSASNSGHSEMVLGCKVGPVKEERYFVGSRDKYMKWDDLLIAMVLEKVKSTGSAQQAIRWFKRQWPAIQNFDHLAERTVLNWVKAGGKRLKQGRKSIGDERKQIIREFTEQIADSDIPMTIVQVHKQVLNMIKNSPHCQQFGQNSTQGAWNPSLSWFTRFIYTDMKLSSIRYTATF